MLGLISCTRTDRPGSPVLGICRPPPLQGTKTFDSLSLEARSSAFEQARKSALEQMNPIDQPRTSPTQQLSYPINGSPLPKRSWSPSVKRSWSPLVKRSWSPSAKLADTHEYKPADINNSDEMCEDDHGSSHQVPPLTLEDSKAKCVATLQHNTTLASLRRAAKVTGERKTPAQRPHM